MFFKGQKSHVTTMLVIVLSISLAPFATTISAQMGSAYATGQDEARGPVPADEVIYTKPNNYEHLVNWYKALEQQYPNYLKVWKASDDYPHGQIENSSGGPDHDYYFVRLTNESTGLDKPEVLFLGNPHGDETPGPVGQYWFTSWILRNALTDEWNTTEDDWLDWLLDNREIYFAVTHNPDGFNRDRRYDGNDYDLNRQADWDHVPNSGMYATGPAPFVTPNSKYMVDFIQDHQIRAGADQHSGVRMLLYPWSSSHDAITATSQKSGKEYDYAPPDFDFYDISSLRAGDFVGNFDGAFDKDNVGPVPPTVGYTAPGGINSWAYGGDVLNNTAEDSHVQDEVFGNYHGAGILWLSPEWSVPKNPDESRFGGDNTPGFGPDVRRFILHQTDLAQPYVWITKDSIANNSIVDVGEDIQFLWKVNGCLVVDDTYIQYGTDPDPIDNFQNTTPHRDMFEGEYWGGTGWENANSGLHTGYVHGQIVKAPDQVGDYYFVIRAKVDQVFKNVTGPSEYGDTPYLRLVKERTDPDYVETLEGADGTQTIKGNLWWWSDIIHIKVVKKPEITNVFPEDGSQWVPTDTNITVGFDLEMNRSETEAAFILDPPAAGAFSWNGTNMTFDPDGDLQSETGYTVTINSSARSYLDTILEQDFSFSFTTSYSSDITPPSVINTTPVDGEQDVLLMTQVRVLFSEDMDKNATAAAFTMVPVTSGQITWENGSSTLVFTPDDLLKGLTDYICSISKAGMDLGRNHLANLHSFDFRTETPDQTRPMVVATDPVDGAVMVPLGANITVNFSEPMFRPYTGPAFGISPAVDGELTWNPASDGLVFDPAEDLEPETVYTVTINSTAADTYFNTLAEAYTFSFTSEDLTPPWIIDNSPKDKDVDVPVDTDIIINFSEPMSEQALLDAFVIEPFHNTTMFLEGTRALFEPAGPLAYSTTYNITMTTAATDVNGLAIAADHTFRFTTEVEPDLEPPRVDNTAPEDKEQNVSVFSFVRMVFSEPVLPPTSGKPLATISPQPLLTPSVTVEGSEAMILTFLEVVAPFLADDTTYTVTVSGEVQDLAGNLMGKDHIFTFTTGFEKRPEVIGNAPEDGSVDVPVDTDIRITFSRPMNWTSAEGAFVITPTVEGTFQREGNTLIFRPSANLAEGKTYTYKMTAGARDEKGNPLAKELTASFDTKKAKGTTPVASSFNMLWALLLLIIIVVASIVAAIAISRRKKDDGDGGGTPGAGGPGPYQRMDDGPAGPMEMPATTPTSDEAPSQAGDGGAVHEEGPVAHEMNGPEQADGSEDGPVAEPEVEAPTDESPMDELDDIIKGLE